MSEHIFMFLGLLIGGVCIGLEIGVRLWRKPLMKRIFQEMSDAQKTVLWEDSEEWLKWYSKETGCPPPPSPLIDAAFCAGRALVPRICVTQTLNKEKAKP